MFVYDIDSLSILDANSFAIRRYGYSKEEFLHFTMSTLGKRVHFSDLDIADKTNFDINPKELWRHNSKDGESWIVQISTQQFRHNGTPVKLAVVHEIDHLLNGRTPERIHFPRIDLVRTQMPFGLIEWNSELEIRDFSEKAEQIFGKNYEDVIGRHASDLSVISIDLQAQLHNKLNQIDESGGTYFTLESEFTDQQGKDVICLWHNSIMTDDKGKALNIYSLVEDITESAGREKELLRNEEMFEQLFRNSPLGIAMLDRNSRILQVNHSFEALFGYTESEIRGEDLDELIVPEDGLNQARSFSDSKETFSFTTKRKTKSGELIDVYIYGVPVVLDGETIAIYGIYMDVTEQINAENKVRQSLEEKEVLLAEIHHRVKNNLAVITGLLELQYHNLENEEAKSALRDSQMRINSMALIHEKLYQNETLSNIDFGVYIEELVNVIVKTHVRSDSKISVDIETDAVDLPITKAIPCGLVINEIVTNSLKYAFTEEIEDPRISMSLTKEDNRAIIQISDNGVGLPKPFEEIGSNSLGTLLIKTLTSQLDADLNVNSVDGTSYHFSFELSS